MLTSTHQPLDPGRSRPLKANTIPLVTTASYDCVGLSATQPAGSLQPMDRGNKHEEYFLSSNMTQVDGSWKFNHHSLGFPRSRPWARAWRANGLFGRWSILFHCLPAPSIIMRNVIPSASHVFIYLSIYLFIFFESFRIFLLILGYLRCHHNVVGVGLFKKFILLDTFNLKTHILLKILFHLFLSVTPHSNSIFFLSATPVRWILIFMLLLKSPVV